MTEREFVDMPVRMAHQPRDKRGFPVPKFVWWNDDGEPDFRVVRPGWVTECVKHNRCWLCGGPLGRHLAFCIGPMCALNRTNSEPPGHYECMRFAARNCPFLTRPLAKRNERDLPEDHVKAAGGPISRNPGCCCVYVTATYKPFQVGGGAGMNKGLLFELGPPERLEFWREGRPATREEVNESVRTGLPYLLDTATRFDGPAGVAELQRQVDRFTKLLDVFLPDGNRSDPVKSKRAPEHVAR